MKYEYLNNRKRYLTTLAAATVLTAGCLFLTACGSPSGAASPEISNGTGASPETVQSTDTAAVSEPGRVYTSDNGVARNTIQVNSSEKVTVVPDIAQVVYAVRTEQKNAVDCRTVNAEDVNSVIELLKGLGVAEASIQTTDYSMYPIYNYSGNTQKITGYEATSTLTVSDLPIDGLNEILTQSVKAGINNIQSITYQSSRYDESYTEALKLAVAAAHEKAKALAEAAGCALGNAVSITENSNYSEARYDDSALASKMRASGMTTDLALESSSNIMPGELDIEVNLTVEYQIH